MVLVFVMVCTSYSRTKNNIRLGGGGGERTDALNRLCLNGIQTHQRFKRTLIYYDTDTQSANFQGKLQICFFLSEMTFFFFFFLSGFTLFKVFQI